MAISVADLPPRAYGRNASQVPPGLFGVLTVLATGLVVAFLYFARDVVVPIALAILLSFLLAPAARWLRRLHIGRVGAVTLTVLIAFLAMLGFAAVVVQELSCWRRRYRSTAPTSRPKFARFQRSSRVAGSFTASHRWCRSSVGN